LGCGRDYLAAKRKKKGAKSLELRGAWVVGEIFLAAKKNKNGAKG
jgi:hypothetical protein